MAGVQNIKTAVGHDHFLAMGLGLPDQLRHLFGIDHTPLHVLLGANGRLQFGDGGGGGPQFTDHHAGGEVGQSHGVLHGLVRGQSRGQYGNHRIPGTGHIKYLACPGWQMKGGFIGL